MIAPESVSACWLHLEIVYKKSQSIRLCEKLLQKVEQESIFFAHGVYSYLNASNALPLSRYSAKYAEELVHCESIGQFLQNFGFQCLENDEHYFCQRLRRVEFFR